MILAMRMIKSTQCSRSALGLGTALDESTYFVGMKV